MYFRNISREKRVLGGIRTQQLNREMYKELGRIEANKKSTCPHCGKEGQNIVMHRWHFDNCKLK
jgi:hypothetical protein